MGSGRRIAPALGGAARLHGHTRFDLDKTRQRMASIGTRRAGFRAFEEPGADPVLEHFETLAGSVQRQAQPALRPSSPLARGQTPWS